jgi:DNA (cytosine-5)-methyltransferase 1
VEGVGGAAEVSGRQASTTWQEPGAGGDIAAADPDGTGRKARVDAGHDGKRVRVEPVGPAASAANPTGRLYGTQSQQSTSDRSGRGSSVTDWGKYAAAVHRWERTLSRPAPSPTIPGSDGRARLSPAFVEWMMGLPEGHVTGHGLSNAQALKMLGNGVVPQQAALALRMLGVAS